MYKILLLPITLLLSLTISAQNIGFNSKDYKKIGVYDHWENSPFRLAKLKGNVQITENPFLNIKSERAVDSTKNVIGFQVSKYASNCYGVRVWLQKPLQLSPKTKYVHILFHTPKQGRVMLIGLGNRQDRKVQSRDIEQFMTNSINTIQTNKWWDAVFPIKGNKNINIYSLVIVPYNESPENLDKDFAAYIDDILINDKPTPRTLDIEYAVNFPKDRIGDKYSITRIGLNTDTIITNPDTTRQHFDYQMINNRFFNALIGQSVIPSISYNGGLADYYVYLDKGRDGEFNTITDADVKPTNDSDIMSYSSYKNKNSIGKKTKGKHPTNLPDFIIDKTMQPGFYLMRYKVDWDNLNSGGKKINPQSANNKTDKTSKIIDVRINIHKDSVFINNANRNGEIVAENGNKLTNLKIPFGKSFTVLIKPAPGFFCPKISITHGYNLSGDKFVHGVQQYETQIININNNKYKIPAIYIDGNINIKGFFTEIKNPNK